MFWFMWFDWHSITSTNGMQLHTNRFIPFVIITDSLHSISFLKPTLCAKWPNISNEMKVKWNVVHKLWFTFVLNYECDSMRLWIVTMAFKNNNSIVGFHHSVVPLTWQWETWKLVYSRKKKRKKKFVLIKIDDAKRQRSATQYLLMRIVIIVICCGWGENHANPIGFVYTKWHRYDDQQFKMIQCGFIVSQFQRITQSSW